MSAGPVVHLGESPKPEEYGVRDAVHIAVIAVQAGEGLTSGIHVAINGAGKAVGEHPNFAIGVVDPFLKKALRFGDWFWLFMKPGTTQGLRHDWNHLAFAKPAPTPAGWWPDEPDFDSDDGSGRCAC